MKPMLLWWPGASVAVADVAAGLTHGLEAHGVELVHYKTDAHLLAAGITLEHLWRQAGRDKATRYRLADVAYQGNKGILERACRARVQAGVEWVLAVSGMYQHPDYFVFLRQCGFKVALVCTESPYDMAAELQVASHVDVVFTPERTVTSVFRTRNPHTYYLPHAWHPGVHGVAEAAAEEDVPALNVVFVGTGFIERVKLLERLPWAEWGGRDRCRVYGTWNLAGPRSKLRPVLEVGDVRNTRTAALYQRAAVGLNLHRTSIRYGRHVPQVHHPESMNPRCFELAACGLFFTTDARAEVRERLPMVPTFMTPAECAAIITRALREPAWRADVAAAAQEAVQRETWTARAAMVLDVLADVEAQAA